MISAALAVAASAASLVTTWWLMRDRQRTRSVARFVARRRRLREHRNTLTVEHRHAAYMHAGIPMLTKEGWIPDVPLDLDAPELALRAVGPDLGETRRRAAQVLPRGLGRPRPSYSQAIRTFDAPQLLFDGPSYHLVDVNVDQRLGVPPLRLEFAPSSYFAGLDTTEVLAYEAADGASAYRGWLSTPFALDRRAALPGVSTLTLRRDENALSFFMHSRNGGQVSVAADTHHVVPAGEFQPIDISPTSMRRDLRLWSTICREYAEEFLGHEESAGRSGWVIDWTDEEPYASLDAGRASGTITPWFLGVALDPLSWKPEILTACVFDADVFDAIFADRLRSNEEGDIIGGRVGLPLTQDVIDDYVDAGNTLAAGESCLVLALRHAAMLTAPQS